jgi:hypothetical protein
MDSVFKDLAARVKPVLGWISNVSLILLILLITAANTDERCGVNDWPMPEKST